MRCCINFNCCAQISRHHARLDLCTCRDCAYLMSPAGRSGKEQALNSSSTPLRTGLRHSQSIRPGRVVRMASKTGFAPSKGAHLPFSQYSLHGLFKTQDTGPSPKLICFCKRHACAGLSPHERSTCPADWDLLGNLILAWYISGIKRNSLREGRHAARAWGDRELSNLRRPCGHERDDRSISSGMLPRCRSEMTS